MQQNTPNNNAGPAKQGHTEYVPSMNGATVIARSKDATYIRIPRNLAQPIAGGCACDWCKAHPTNVPQWDTLMVPTRNIVGNDYVSHVHMPDPNSFRLYLRSKKQLAE